MKLKTKRGIVIDKSFLRGAKREHITALSETYTLLMPDSLLYECVKEENPSDRAQLFKKFPDKNSPYILIPPICDVLRHEIRTNTIFGKPSKRAANKDYGIHLRLIDEGYCMTTDQLLAFERKRQLIENDTNAFIRLVKSLIKKMSSEFYGLSDEKTKQKRDVIEKKIALDKDYIVEIINSERIYDYANMPTSQRITNRWATFRFFQIYHLYVIDFYLKYKSETNIDNIFLRKDSPQEKAFERIRHEMLDAQYLLYGLLEGGFATNELKLTSWWKLLSTPSGKLISNLSV